MAIDWLYQFVRSGRVGAYIILSFLLKRDHQVIPMSGDVLLIIRAKELCYVGVIAPGQDPCFFECWMLAEEMKWPENVVWQVS